MTTSGTRRICWGALAALTIGATGIVAPDTSGSTATALTIGVWVDRGPSDHRITGTALSADGSIAYTTSDYLNGVLGDGRVMRSTDSAATWSTVDGIPAGRWSAVATSADGSDVVVVGRTGNGTSPHRIWVSGDGGDTWTDRTPDPDADYVDADITADGSTIVVTAPSGVIRSDDGGASWSTLPGFPVNPEQVTVGRSGASVIVHAAYPASVRTWRTGDATTSSMLTAAGTVVDLDASDTGQVVAVAATSPHTVEVSADGGQTWTSAAQSGRTNAHMNVAVSGDGSRLALSSYGEPLSDSSDGGATWTVVDNPDQRAWLALTMGGDGRRVLAGRENQPLRVRIPTPPPTVASVAPAAGPVTGSTSITISGTSFHDVLSVEIGGVAATSFTATSVYEISVVTPPGVAGSAAVTVTTAHGSSTLPDGFTFYTTAPPAITAQSADSGTHLGGQLITLDGSGLAEVTSVMFGSRAAPIVSASRTQLMVRTPPNRVGLMDVAVESPFGRYVLTDGWMSAWEAREPTPEWSEIDDRNGYALEIVDDGAGGLHIGGFFPDTAAIRWDGGSTVVPVANGLVVGSDMSQDLFAFGVQAILPASDDSVWLGGSLATADGEWPLVRASLSGVRTPTETLDGMVLALAPGLDATTLVAGGLFTSTVAELDIATGTWTPLGDDGNGGPAFLPGTYPDPNSPTRAVAALARRANGRLLAGGSFTLWNTPAESHDLVAEWDGTAWRSIVPGLETEMATSFDVGTIDGEEVVAIATSGSNGFGRVLLLHADDTIETIGIFSSFVRDVAIVHDTVVAVGFFQGAQGSGVPSQVDYAGALVDGDWVDLAVGGGGMLGLETVAVLADDRVVVGGFHQRIGGDGGPSGLAVSTPITALVAAATPLTVTSIEGSIADGDGLVSVTVTGTGFDADTDATLDGRPVDALVVMSSTELRFTTTAADTERVLTLYGAAETATGRLAATPDAPQPEPETPTPASDEPRPDGAGTDAVAPDVSDDIAVPESDPTVPTTTLTALPSLDEIASFPIRTLIPPGTVLAPGSPNTVTADGFEPGEEVRIIVASTPRLLGTATVDADGTISSEVTLPTDLLGDHTLVVWSPTTGRGVRQPITIASAILPATR